MEFKVNLNFPKYTQQQNKTVQNIGDLTIPEGTKVNWIFNTKNTNEITLRFPDSLVNLNPIHNNEFHWFKL